jgi:hypothetical protein
LAGRGPEYFCAGRMLKQTMPIKPIRHNI